MYTMYTMVTRLVGGWAELWTSFEVCHSGFGSTQPTSALICCNIINATQGNSHDTSNKQRDAIIITWLAYPCVPKYPYFFHIDSLFGRIIIYRVYVPYSFSSEGFSLRCFSLWALRRTLTSSCCLSPPAFRQWKHF